MKNRIKDLREARGWSLEQLAARFGDSTTASTVHKLETGTMKLTTEWMEKLAKAFGGIDPIEIIDDRPRAGFAEDVTRFVASDGPPALTQHAAKAGHALYRVTSAALDEIGILKGDAVEVDEGEEARREVATGDIVVAEVETGPGEKVSVIREFIEPALLITNSRAENAIPINTRTTRTTILGVVVGSHRHLPRRR